ncbi:alpha/beta fold hydrolase [Kribbella sp. NPDC051586]|uniref:alpha/beta fold hydrolase n=1 Tax=Kribbella sp. NPDC051586 TaxID=3364118 RepID=UPI00379A7AD3
MAHLTADDGCRLWTEVSGSGPSAVLVHGGPGWWDVFHDLSLPGFTLHRWDQRGCGRSERRGPYTLARFVADLATVCGPGPCIVIGHSWGASLALEFAQAHPDVVSRLVLVSSVGLDGPPPDYRARVAERLAGTAEADPWIARISVNLADRMTALTRARRLNTPWFEPNQVCADALRDELSAVPDRAGACRRVVVPTLMVHGAEDLRPPYVTDSLLEALPNAERVVLDGVGHYPWIENPTDFQKAVREFLTRPNDEVG